MTDHHLAGVMILFMQRADEFLAQQFPLDDQEKKEVKMFRTSGFGGASMLHSSGISMYSIPAEFSMSQYFLSVNSAIF